MTAGCRFALRPSAREVNVSKEKMMAVCVVMLGLILGGCESGGGGSSDGDDDVSGSWNATEVGGDGDSGTLTLTQDGTSVSGTFSSHSGYHGNVSGSLDGGHLVVRLSYSSGHSALDATVSGGSMEGSYSANSGQSGKFTASRP